MKIDMDEIVLRVPGLLSRPTQIRFTGEFVEYKNKRLRYHEIEGVKYKFSKMTYDFIMPGEEEFDVGLYDSGCEYDAENYIVMSFVAGIINWPGRKEKERVYFKLVDLIETLIAPRLLQKVFERICSSGEAVPVGGLRLSREGIHYNRSRLFRKGIPCILSWNNLLGIRIKRDKYSSDKYSFLDKTELREEAECAENNVDGMLNVYLDVNRFQVNSPILPRLLLVCSQEFGSAPLFWLFDTLFKRKSHLFVPE